MAAITHTQQQASVIVRPPIESTRNNVTATMATTVKQTWNGKDGQTYGENKDSTRLDTNSSGHSCAMKVSDQESQPINFAEHYGKL